MFYFRFEFSYEWYYVKTFICDVDQLEKIIFSTKNVDKYYLQLQLETTQNKVGLWEHFDCFFRVSCKTGN